MTDVLQQHQQLTKSLMLIGRYDSSMTSLVEQIEAQPKEKKILLNFQYQVTAI
jgi:hypothetical protein